jgi:hypothetical protein
MRFPGSLAVLLVFIVAAGCVGDGGAASRQTSGPPSNIYEPGALLAEGGGAITGTVVNEETAPVVGALIGLDATQSTTTDPSGQFSFKAVSPGAHEIQVQAIGYSSIGRAIEVTEGEVLQLTLTLAALPVQEPHLQVIILKGFSICDYMVWVISGRLDDEGVPCDTNNQAQNRFNITVEGTWEFLVAEMKWQGGFANSDTFRMFNADDGDCVSGSPCYGLKYGRGYIKLEGEPGPSELNSWYDPWMDDRGPAYPERQNGSFEMFLNAQWIGAFASELGANPACQTVLTTSQGTGYKEGCLGVGVSTGIAFDAYVSIFHLMKPDPMGPCCPATTYSAIPDG